MFARNGSRNGSSAVATSSVIPDDEKSVLLRTRPRPGKCLTAPSTPSSSIPRRKATEYVATVVGSDPYWRPHRPIGWLARPMSFGTVSATGARLTLTPAAFICRAQPDASFVSSAGASSGLVEGLRRAGEPVAAQLVDDAALLVGGDHQADVARGPRRHQPREVLGGPRDLRRPLPAAEVDDVADVLLGDEVSRDDRPALVSKPTMSSWPIRWSSDRVRHAGGPARQEAGVGGRGWGTPFVERLRRRTPRGVATPARATVARRRAPGEGHERPADDEPGSERERGRAPCAIGEVTRRGYVIPLAMLRMRGSTATGTSAMIAPAPIPIVLDVDTGVDDACALLLAALHPLSTCGRSRASAATPRSPTSSATR